MYGISSDFQKRDVAIYARVSTEHEAQLSALENQMDWYKPILAARPEWTLVKQYVDEGITGTSAEKRPHFMEMIKDAKAHKFNMIITREVSRFARNTVDTLQYTRMLKDYKEYFRERKKEIEGKINRLAESIKNLTPIPAKDIAGDYSERLSELKKKLGEYTDFDGLVIPESIVEAFIQKIWVSKDEFRWYLRTNRSGSAEEAEHIQIGSFTLTLEDAKAYQYSFSTRKRIYNWEDLNVTVWI